MCIRASVCGRRYKVHTGRILYWCSGLCGFQPRYIGQLALVARLLVPCSLDTFLIRLAVDQCSGCMRINEVKAYCDACTAVAGMGRDGASV